ncbi:pyridoxamine 5'-phosphate oxidase family protein [Amycolatopsis sp. K13G38]|uniref:Pyridoxamine 5'-phosphate oxidase family protein n=1 Tax=Amycolatopsis acididurans TaxID=2724524 RepID=A0ABX1IX18_9PSEU|nr:MSMEG_1061 family FMN-dependent PPOX-type flavoprotein [Amycolatopsis acididurans]NKQ51324.1 pyridoxamine 5'-phosphate oxidase family protein [Amycolatopsis acididurans]
MSTWKPDEAQLITSEEELRSIVEPPVPAIAAKGVPGIDPVSRRFIEAARLFFVATRGRDGGLDVSPRGDEGRAVIVFDDDKTIAFADRRGNRRVDSLRNLLLNPEIALLFTVPGASEVLRVRGTGRIVRSAPFFAELGDPALAVVVDVEDLFVHCGRALSRSGTWKPEIWPDRAGLPTGAELLRSQLDAIGFTG